MSSDPQDFIDNGRWPDDDISDITAELVGSSTIDDLARAAKEHGILITISFIPAGEEDEEAE